jgi:glycosyltransferase involved in cell wall biosynthesis
MIDQGQNQDSPRIVLTMIVKNEAHVIERCIASVRPIIDAYLIVDTGSEDGTQEVIRRVLADLPGEVVDQPWVDFAQNRSEALELARPYGEYSLMIDADVECVIEAGFDSKAFRRSLDADVYRIMLRDFIHYHRPQLTSTRLPFFYRGVLHEFLVIPDEAVDGGILEGVSYRSHTDGARWANPQKYSDDASLLAGALAKDEDPELESRYAFYLAQSLRDAGSFDAAELVYRKRAEMGGWSEETYVAWLWHARMLKNLGRPIGQILESLAKAQEAVPTRAEAWCEAAKLLREAGMMQSAFVYARRAVEIHRPADALFLEVDVYEWRALHEYSIAAYYVGDYVGGIRACHRLLYADKMPPAERAATEENLKFYPEDAIAGDHNGLASPSPL